MASKRQGEALAKEAEVMRRLGLQLVELQEMGLVDLRAKYQDIYGEEAKSKNLPFLRKKIAFRLQERVEGGLSPAALARIEELAPRELPRKESSEKRQGPKPAPLKVVAPPRDSRLPEAGTIITREHRGCPHEVEVLDQGFRYRGRTYTSLSTIAKEITGTAWNGFTFFGLAKENTHGEG